MKTAGWLGIVFGLLFFLGGYGEVRAIDDAMDVLQILRAGTPTILLGVLFLVLDRRLAAPSGDAR